MDSVKESSCFDFPLETMDFDEFGDKLLNESYLLYKTRKLSCYIAKPCRFSVRGGLKTASNLYSVIRRTDYKDTLGRILHHMLCDRDE